MNDYNTVPQAAHRLELTGREHLTVSGVEDVERFDETGIIMFWWSPERTCTSTSCPWTAGSCMWTDASTPLPMKRERRSARAFSAGSWGELHGNQHLPAADPVRPVHPAGRGRSPGVRSAAGFPGADPAPDRRAGRMLLPAADRVGVFIRTAPGPGTAAGLCAAGIRRRRRPLFHAAGPLFAPGVGFLVRKRPVFAAPPLAAGPLCRTSMQKNIYSGKKPLLFCRKVLYNNKRRRFRPLSQRRRRLWHKNAAETKSSTSAPVS